MGNSTTTLIQYELVGYSIPKPWALLWSRPSTPAAITASSFTQVFGVCLWEFVTFVVKKAIGEVRYRFWMEDLGSWFQFIPKVLSRVEVRALCELLKVPLRQTGQILSLWAWFCTPELNTREGSPHIFQLIFFSAQLRIEYTTPNVL